MGNAGSSSMHRHKSSDISTPNSPFRELSVSGGRDSVSGGVAGNIGGGGSQLAAAVGGDGAAQAFTFDNKPADVSVLHGDSPQQHQQQQQQQDDEEPPYYTKPVGSAVAATATATTTSTASTADNSATATTTTADPEFSEPAEPRKRSNTLSEGCGSAVMAASESGSKDDSAKDDQSGTNKGALPTVMRWDGGGKNVMIAGTFSKWKPIPMSRSHGNFVTIIDLPEGDHQYKFCVDGEWRHDPKLKSIETDQGDKNNLVSVRQSDFEVFQALAKDSENAPNYAEREYSQEVPQAKPWEKVSGPPVLPPHLLQVILNKDTPLSCEPTLLPEPNHVMLNHLYALSIKDGVMVLSATHRYRKKYVTTLLYKPI